MTTFFENVDAIQRRNAERYARLALVELPRLRCIGFAFLSLGVYLDNRFLLGNFSLRPWLTITTIMAVYAALSWPLIVVAYRRFRIDLTLVSLIVDIPIWVMAIYYSGGEKSWLFFILFMRFADQTQTTFRRCLGFVAFGTFAYAAMLAWIAVVDGRQVDNGTVISKLMFISIGGVYIALTALTAESRRVHLKNAMHMARELIGRLEQQSVELRDARAHAEEASAAKSEFLANMSHEMRTPLHGILGMLQLAIDGERSPERARQLEMARRSAESLLQTIEGILDFSKIEARMIELEPVYFSIRDLITDTTKALAVTAADKGLEIAFAIERGVPDHLWGDPMRLRQIIVNLLGNAIKFTDAGEIVMRVRAERPRPSSVVVHFEVRDTGIGIPREKQQMIFDPFAQADSSHSRRFGGTGLGLSIVARLVDAMGGRIDVESEPGKGSTFRFFVTLASDIISGGVQPEWQRALAGQRVIIVEPNATSRAIIGDILRSYGMVPEAYGSIAAQPPIREAFSCVVADARLLAASAWRPQVPVVRIISPLELPDDSVLSVSRPVGERELLDAVAIGLGLRDRPEGMAAPLTDSSRAMHVLVVDDHPINQEFAAEALRRLGHTVTTASNGQEALDRLERESFDFVLMDVQMPEIDGVDATRRFRESERGRHTPIVGLTAHGGREERDRCIEAGMDDVLVKPASSGRLAAVIARTETILPQSVIDNQAFRTRVRNAFVEQTPRLLAAIRSGIDAQDADEIARHAHTLKGAVSNFNDDSAQALTMELERAGKAADFARAASLLPQVEEAMRGIERRL